MPRIATLPQRVLPAVGAVGLHDGEERPSPVPAVGFAVYGLSIGLAVAEVGRVGLVDRGVGLATAIVATALVMPLHLWHLRYGLRGERPPHAGTTLALMAGIQAVALLVVGPTWSFMLAVLATSALIVLRPIWAFGVLVACAGAPVLAQGLHPNSAEYFSHNGYYAYSIVLRAGTQFALVWLAAAVYQLAASETALATEAVEQERGRLQREVRAGLTQRLSALAPAARAAARHSTRGARAPAERALDEVTTLAGEAQNDLRAVVASARAPVEHPAAQALAMRARFERSPIGRAITLRRAWWTFAAVHVLAFAYPLLVGVGLLLPQFHTRPLPAVVGCFALAGLQLPVSMAVARGRPVSMPLLRLAATVAVVALTLWVAGAYMENACFVIGSMAVLCLPGRWAAVGVVLGVAGYLTFDTVAFTIDYPGVTPYLYVWNVFAGATPYLLFAAGIYGASRLVASVAALDLTLHELAENVAHGERRRMSRDLHDVLGQALAGISLKTDLATRLLGRDDAAATREAADVAAIADTLVDEMESVARGLRTATFTLETETAVELLSSAGVLVTTDIELGALDTEASALLGWAVREGATNILRHAHARTCRIEGTRSDSTLRVLVVNDGALTRPQAPGTGLVALAERATALRGRVRADAGADGTFALTVELPC